MNPKGMKEMKGLAPASYFDTFHSFVVNDFVNYFPIRLFNIHKKWHNSLYAFHLH